MLRVTFCFRLKTNEDIRKGHPNTSARFGLKTKWVGRIWDKEMKPEQKLIDVFTHATIHTNGSDKQGRQSHWVGLTWWSFNKIEWKYNRTTNELGHHSVSLDDSTSIFPLGRIKGTLRWGILNNWRKRDPKI